MRDFRRTGFYPTDQWEEFLLTHDHYYDCEKSLPLLVTTPYGPSVKIIFDEA